MKTHIKIAIYNLYKQSLLNVNGKLILQSIIYINTKLLNKLLFSIYYEYIEILLL